MIFPGQTDDGWSQVAASVDGKPALGWVRRDSITPVNLSSAPPAAKPAPPPAPKVVAAPSPSEPVDRSSAPPAAKPALSPAPKLADVPSPSKPLNGSKAPLAAKLTPSPEPKVADVPSASKSTDRSSAPTAVVPTPSPKPKVAAVPSSSTPSYHSSPPPAAVPPPSTGPEMANVPGPSKITPGELLRGLFGKRSDKSNPPSALEPNPPSENSVFYAQTPSFLRPLAVTRSDLDCGGSYGDCKAIIELTYRGRSGADNRTYFVHCDVSARLERAGDSGGTNRSFSGSGKMNVSQGFGRTTMTVDLKPGASAQPFVAMQLSDVACSYR